MPQFQVQDMTCKHCEANVINAIKEVDAGADISIDLSLHLLTITSIQDAATLGDAIREAGYTPFLLSEQ
ncbi:heavy-metal-associated domain-containing protein [Undibacterium sp. Di24W]|uniref:heavy-metal-associated domain-containing protein n=1 Tax=Undibacterium sp. Di24W TaxID=3413033 RepID=UPI003BF29DFC